ncbi:MAG: hypothetical protein WCT14_11400 [Treponemataceae bacterium]
MADEYQEKQGLLSRTIKVARDGRAVTYCLSITVIAAIGALLGVMLKTPLIVLVGLLPAAVYEFIRTKGASTKFSSMLLVILLVAEAIVIVFKIEINLTKILGIGSLSIARFRVPIGDIRIMGTALIAVLSVILFVRTAGVYTKWLAALIFVVGFVFIYALSPAEFGRLFNWAVQEIKHVF